jgi:hypothetical protein
MPGPSFLPGSLAHRDQVDRIMARTVDIYWLRKRLPLMSQRFGPIKEELNAHPQGFSGSFQSLIVEIR